MSGSILAALSRLETGQADISMRLGGIETRLDRVEAEQTRGRVDVLAKLEAIQNDLTAVRDDIGVDMGGFGACS